MTPELELATAGGDVPSMMIVLRVGEGKMPGGAVLAGLAVVLWLAAAPPGSELLCRLLLCLGGVFLKSDSLLPGLPLLLFEGLLERREGAPLVFSLELLLLLLLLLPARPPLLFPLPLLLLLLPPPLPPPPLSSVGETAWSVPSLAPLLLL